MSLRKILVFIWALCLMIPTAVGMAQSNTSLAAVVLKSEGPVTPVLEDYLKRGIQTAIERNAETVILELDTPGGSVDLTISIVQTIRSSEIPVIVYVSPGNAMAGSAGTIITLAGHVAAMAPETTIGAASPVGSQGEDIGETMESKVKEMLKAQVRSLTRSRSEEARKLAEATIETARAVTEEEALSAGLVDVIAADIPDLLRQVDGRVVEMPGGPKTLSTAGKPTVEVGNTLIEQLLLLLVNPNVVFLLLAVGVQAVLIELSSPGGWFAGFLGALCLLLAFYGLGLLPVNWFGILFLVLAFVLFILELKTPTVGALTTAGVISFIIGALVLFNSVRLPGFPLVSVPLVIGTAVFIGLGFLAAVIIALRAQKTPVGVGAETLPGKRGIATTALTPHGSVQVGGELWSAILDEGEPSLPEGERVEVVRTEGLRLVVRHLK